jgi:hypothetical protein
VSLREVKGRYPSETRQPGHDGGTLR